jgi:hypothetical protein
MVNDRLHGEHNVDAMNCHDFFRRNIIPAAARRYRDDPLNFTQIATIQIVLKVAQRDEPRFQASSLWCATGEIRNDTGTRERERM